MLLRGEDKLFLIAFFVLQLLVSQGCAKTNAFNPDQNCESNRLKVRGSSIVGPNGSSISLRGIYTRATWLDSEQEVEWFKEWGINFVRILLTHDDNYWQVVNEGKEDLGKRCIVRPENLQHMDERVKWLEKHQIYFIMEIHWRALGISEQFLKPKLLKRQLVSMYKKLAQRYKNVHYLMGFCMFSEIYVAPEYYELYNKLCTAIVDAVHEVDPTYIVSASGVQTSSPASLIDPVYIDRPNVIYDFHFYSPKIFTHYRTYYGDLRYPGWVADGWAPGAELIDMDYLRRKLKPAIDFSERWNVPVWCGEFGAFGNAPDNSSARWERDTVFLLEKNNIPWILWRWKDKEKTVPERWKSFWQDSFEKQYVTIVPHGGPFAGTMNVEIHCTIPQASIRYTTDGNVPDIQSKLYKAPFVISESTKVKAAAFAGDKAVTKPDSASFYKLQARKPDNPSDYSGGLKCFYYEGSIEEIDNFKKNEPKKTAIVDCFDLSLAERDDRIALLFEGFIEVPVEGLYYFYISDAGASRLYIGDKLVVDNVESRWISRRSGFVALKAGMHRINAEYRRADKDEVFYSDDRRDEWFMVEYEGPGIKRQEIPAKALWHSDTIPGHAKGQKYN